MVKRLCISVSDEDSDYLEVNKVSPSRLLQEEIRRMREIDKTYKARMEDLLMKIQVREEKILKLNDIIMEMGAKIDVLEKKNTN